MPQAGLFHTHHWVRHLSQELDPEVPLFLPVRHLEDIVEDCEAQSEWHCLDPSCWGGQPEGWGAEREMG